MIRGADGGTVRRLLGTLLLFCVFSSSPLTAQSSQTSESSSPTSAAERSPSEPHAKKFTGYSLSPELYKKAKRLGAIRFAFRIFSFFFSLFALWLILRFKWSARFRDLAERVSLNRI